MVVRRALGVVVALLMRVRSVGSMPACETSAASQLRSDEVARAASALQCPAARGVVPMPCPNATTRMLVHLHVPKTGGRALKQDLVDVVGRPSCRGAPDRFKDDRSCFVSTEMRWDGAIAAASEAPLVVTMVRDAVPWALSAMEHSRQHAHAGAVDDVVDAGCFGPGVARATCGMFQPLRDFVPRRWDGGAQVRGESACAPRLDTIRERLEATIFGVLDHYGASLCLMRYQFGAFARDPGAFAAACDCRRRAGPRGDSARPSDATLERGTRAVARRDGKACARGDHLACVKADDGLSVKVESVAAISRSMAAHSALYARALDVFLARVAVAERATGLRLVCDDAPPPGAAAAWNPSGDTPPSWRGPRPRGPGGRGEQPGRS